LGIFGDPAQMVYMYHLSCDVSLYAFYVVYLKCIKKNKNERKKRKRIGNGYMYCMLISQNDYGKQSQEPTEKHVKSSCCI